MTARVPDGALKTSTILGFWAPLAGTWWMMALEGVALSAILARLENPTFNLAAYGVAFAFAILVESPVILLMSASTAMVRDAGTHRALWHFSLKIIGLITLLMVLLVLPPVWRVVADLLHLEAEVARLVHLALWCLLPWPGAIGDRRYHQGLMIRAGRTRAVALGTAFRVGAMLLGALALARFSGLPGAQIAGVALSLGVVTEAVAVRWMSWSIVRSLEGMRTDSPAPTQTEVFHFYLPLALTSMLALAAQPIITFFVGRAAFAVESLAVLPVLNSLTFLLRALALSYQEVVIALVGVHRENLLLLGRVAAGLFASVAALMLLVAYTPLASGWLRGVAGLSAPLALFAGPALKVFAWLPMLSVVQAFLRALLVDARRTRPVGWATAAEVCTIAVVLLLCIAVGRWQGALAAATAVIAGRLIGLLCLWPSARRIMTQRHELGAAVDAERGMA